MKVAYTASVHEEKIIGLFEDMESLRGFANLMKPHQVQYSEHPNYEAASEFAEKLKTMTPEYDIRYYKLG